MTNSRPNLLIVASARARKDLSSPLLRLVRDNIATLRQYQIHTTKGTGQRLYGTGLFKPEEIKLHLAGRDGGIAQLAAIAAKRQCVAAILLLDPSDPWSDAVENRALKRVLIQTRIRLMTTYAAAERWLALEAATQASASSPIEVDSWKPKNWKDGKKNIFTVDSHLPTEEPKAAPGGNHASYPLYLPLEMRTIALISHDQMKVEMVNFVKPNASLLAKHQRILTTGTTGWLLKLLFASQELESAVIQEFREVGSEDWVVKIIVKILGDHFERKPKNMALAYLLAQLREELGIASNDLFVLKVTPLPSGPKGGDVLIANAVLDNECHSIVFFHDPSTAHPHNDDIRLLEHTSQLPGVFCECVSDSASADWWIRGLETELNSSRNSSRNLAQELRELFQLHDVLLIDRADNQDGPALGVELAHGCAGYMNQRLINELEAKDEVRIGLGWGFGPGHVLQKLKEMRNLRQLEPLPHPPKNILWSPLIGTLTPEITEREASTKAQDYCNFYGGEVDGFPCGGFARNRGAIPERAKSLISKLESADIILTSASPWDEGIRSDLYKETGVNPIYFPEPLKAIGLMSGVAFDENGSSVAGDYAAVGLDMDGFKRAAERGSVILICGGVKRHPVVLALLRARVVSTLVTTTKTAEWLLGQSSLAK